MAPRGGATGVVVLGGSAMSTAASSLEPNADSVLELLTEALRRLDAMGAPPEIGARLQHVIDELESDEAHDSALS